MLTVRRSPLAISSLLDFSPALSVLHAMDEASTVSRRGALHEDDDHFTVTVAVPGMSRDELTLKVSDNVLTLEGERTASAPEGFRAIHQERQGFRLSQKVSLPKTVDPDGVRAALKDGVLTVVLPKSEASRVRRITIS